VAFAFGQDEDERVLEFFVSKPDTGVSQEEHRAALRELQDFVTSLEGVLVSSYLHSQATFTPATFTWQNTAYYEEVEAWGEYAALNFEVENMETYNNLNEPVLNSDEFAQVINAAQDISIIVTQVNSYITSIPQSIKILI